MTGPSRDGMASALKSLMGVSNAPDTRSKRVMRRNAIVRKSDFTNVELGHLVRERDTNPEYDLLDCGCEWHSGKNGTSQYTVGPDCAPWPPAYRSKRKYTRST